MRSVFVSFAITFAALVVPVAGEVEVASVVQRDTPTPIQHESGVTIQAIFGQINEDGSFTWEYLPDKHFIRQDTITYFAAPPGEYLIVSGEGRIIKIVEEGNPKPKPNPKPEPLPPDPEPEPDPKPDPKPEPKPDLLQAKWIIVLEETMDRSKFFEEASTVRDAEFTAFVSELGLSLRIYDPDQGNAAGYVDAAKARGVSLPCMFIYESEKKYKVVPAPKSVSEAEQLIRGSIIR